MRAFQNSRHAWRRCMWNTSQHQSEAAASCIPTQLLSHSRSSQCRLFSSGPLHKVDPEVRADLELLAAEQPHPVSLQQVINTRKKVSAAKFLHTEVPIRLAERVRAIERIADWTVVPELVDMHGRLVRAFKGIRAVKRERNLVDFTRVAKGIMSLEKPGIVLAAKGLRALRKEFPEKYNAEFADRFLNNFLLNRIGCTVLIGQYLALPRGIIDPQCDPLDVCREAARTVSIVTQQVTGRKPLIRVEAHSAVEGDNEDPQFSYIPSVLQYIIMEILKNSSRATLEIAGTAAEIEDRPVSVVICADEKRVAIRVSDRARGIPFDVGKRVWSYTYTTAVEGTPLAGYGVGLPLSRLYAWYLGGSLDLVSLPGYGTDAYLFLPRIQSEQVEVVPDSDHVFQTHDLMDFTVH